MMVHDLLLIAAQYAPDRRLLLHEDGWLTYGMLTQRAQALAGFLVGQVGLKRGDRILILQRNSAEALVSLFGCLIAGGIAVPGSVAAKPPELRHYARDAEPGVVIGESALLAAYRRATDGQWGGWLIPTDSSRAVNEPLPGPDLARTVPLDVALHHSAVVSPVGIDIDPAVVMYTSGSTAKPKGVVLTHLNLVSNARSVVEYLQLESSDRVMLVLPLHYIYGLSVLLTHVMVGGSVVVDNRIMYPNLVLQSMAAAEVTGLSGVPSTFALLLGRSTVRDMQFPALRYVTQAGGHMPVAQQRAVATTFSPARLFVMYGATEAGPRLTYMPPEDLDGRWGSIGKPVPNVEVLVADQDGRRLPQGEHGELVARGSNIMFGYWQDRQATRRVLRGGLYFTGDLGYADAEGYLYITGRTSDMIKIKGFRVSAGEIEEALCHEPEVAEAAVVGVPDKRTGEAAVAFVVAADGRCVDTAALLRRLSESLSAHKIPSRVVLLNALPLGSSGKVDRRQLRSHVAQDQSTA